eukprot:TRINITY_DN945_c0_g1_i5.p1 TRINITY_DN945_c0_g1~~TRINITY_DN945_c0_g1_i5.p1  ORF type:complete len:119 (-),score=27.37 TRINITY_DN945_c0_g1_i5:162-473(-)
MLRSLVGSEMCIRDRVSGGHAAPRQISSSTRKMWCDWQACQMCCTTSTVGPSKISHQGGLRQIHGARGCWRLIRPPATLRIVGGQYDSEVVSVGARKANVRYK